MDTTGQNSPANSDIKVAAIYYSAAGNVHALATATTEAAAEGTQVK
ncbi:hypothetical protein [Nocardia yunnanensis]|nr:hypothetical protein [Nocardia yunnanensis]